jgi:hypothetical protein
MNFLFKFLCFLFWCRSWFLYAATLITPWWFWREKPICTIAQEFDMRHDVCQNWNNWYCFLRCKRQKDLPKYGRNMLDMDRILKL